MERTDFAYNRFLHLLPTCDLQAYTSFKLGDISYDQLIKRIYHGTNVFDLPDEKELHKFAAAEIASGRVKRLKLSLVV